MKDAGRTRKIEETVGHCRAYVTVKITQGKLNAAERASDTLSVFIARTLVAIVFLFLVLFVSVAASCDIGRSSKKAFFMFLATLMILSCKAKYFTKSIKIAINN